MAAEITRPALARPVRVGIIGCGSVLSAYMAEFHRLRARGAAEVIVACGRPAQRDRALQLGIPRFVTDEAAVIEDAAVDLVLVLTSMSSHARLVIAALDAGKHVLCEKPLATSLREAAAVLERARTAPGVLLVAPFTPLSPTFRAIAARVRRGDIGAVVSARARYGWAGPDWNAWFFDKGAGAMLDLGVYCVTTLVALLGPARRVTALSAVAVPTRTVAGAPVPAVATDNAQIAIEHVSGALSLVTTGYTMQQVRSPAVELYGKGGTLQMLGDDWDPDGYELFRPHTGAWQIFKETDPEWPWTDGLPHLVACLREGRRPDLPPDLSVHVLEILLAAEDSGRTGERRDIASRFSPLALDAGNLGEAIHLTHDRARRADVPESRG